MKRSTTGGFSWSIPVFLCTALLYSHPAARPRTLSGSIRGTLPTGRYLVTESITVEKQDTLVIDSGSILSFNPITALHVAGHIVCMGTPSAPVIFTAQKKSGAAGNDEQPRSFDWGGITIYSDASAMFSFSRIIYSTYGLEIASRQSSVNLQAVSFGQNGRYDLQVEGEAIDLKQNVPYSLNLPLIKPKNGEIPLVLYTPPQSFMERHRTVLRTTATVAAIGGIAAGIVGHFQAANFHEKYIDQQNEVPANPEQANRIAADTEEYRNKTILWEYIEYGGFGLGFLGGVGFTLTFFF